MKLVDYHDVEAKAVDEQGAAGVHVRWVISEDDGAKNFFMRIFEVQPGGHSPYHQHRWEHEVFILEGEADVVSEDSKFKAGEGTVVFIKPDEYHQFRNESDRLMRFICLIPKSG